MHTTHTDAQKLGEMLETLHRFVRQRPGLEFANYGDAASYRRELREIARDKRDAEAMIWYVWRASVSGFRPELLSSAAKIAFSGRLSWTGTGWEYTTGQYWPTEYRRAACAALSLALRTHWEQPTLAKAYRAAKNALGVGVAKRWFR